LEANQVFLEILGESPNDFRKNLDVAVTFAMMGRVEESVPYFARAERACHGSPDSIFFMNYSNVKLLQGDNEEALRFAERARGIDKDRPKSPAHAFYAHMGVRCGQVDSTVQYLAEFHACYPKEAWIWKIRALEEESDGTKRLTPEFLEFMQTQSERFNRSTAIPGPPAKGLWVTD
jgi:tetratricopeptide (TPR) repeat protein